MKVQVSKVYLEFYRCLTPLHHGAGEGLGPVDRPLLRDSWTQEPYVQSSSIRGKTRLYAGNANGLEYAFGPARQSGQDTPNTKGEHGFLSFTDARVLLLPVASRFGTTAFLTSRQALGRLGAYAAWAGRRDLAEQVKELLNFGLVSTLGEKACGCYQPGSECGSGTWLDKVLLVPGARSPSYFLEGLGAVPKSTDQEIGKLLYELAEQITAGLFPEGAENAAREWLRSRILLAGDKLSELALACATAVEPATAVEGETGTAKDGTLRYTEYLPEGTVLVGLRFEEKHCSTTSFSIPSQRVLALGAHSTGGKGLVRVETLGGNNGR